MIIINDDGCIKCGACEGTCPTSAIELTPTTIIHCDLCGGEPKCADVCPQGALKAEEYEIAEGITSYSNLNTFFVGFHGISDLRVFGDGTESCGSV